MVELGQAHRRVASSLAVVPRLRVELLSVVRVELPAGGGVLRRDALRVEARHARTRARGSSGCRRDAGSSARCGSPVRSSRCSDARSTPATSRSPQASVRAKPGDSARGATSSSTSAARDLVAGRPRRELVDLGRELVEVVADELDQEPARLRLGLRPRSLNWSPTQRATAFSGRPRAAPRPSRRPPSRSARPSSAHRRRARASCPAPAPPGSRRPPSRRAPSTPPPRRRHEPAARAEEAERVARGDSVVAGRLGGVEKLDRVGLEARAKARDGAVDLRTVAARDQVRRLQLVRHRCQA